MPTSVVVIYIVKGVDDVSELCFMSNLRRSHTCYWPCRQSEQNGPTVPVNIFSLLQSGTKVTTLHVAVKMNM